MCLFIALYLNYYKLFSLGVETDISALQMAGSEQN